MNESVKNGSDSKQGMGVFSLIWVGQLISILGTSMVRFGLMYWAWLETGQATALALMGFFSFAPQLLLQPFAGALVDRWNRKITIIISDFIAGMGTIAILFLYNGNMLEIWHLYIIAAIVGAFASFQFPAFSAAVTMMVDKKQYSRAASMLGLAGSVSEIFAAPIAAVLLVWIGLSGILMIDIVTFSFALTVLIVAKIPQPPKAADIGKGMRGLWRDSMYGFKYIFKRKPLLGLQLTYFSSNFFGNMAFILMAPMILAITSSDKVALANFMGDAGVGGVIGGILLSAWGGSLDKKILLIMGGIIIEGLVMIFFGIVLGVPLWAIIGFILAFSGPFVWGSSQGIWQSKVEPNKQGRVFGARGFIAMSAGAVGMVIAGPLADRVFEPGMAGTGFLARTFGWLLGNDIGSGMRLIMIICGIGTLVTAIVALLIPKIRNLEKIVPDADHPSVVLEDYKERLNAAYRKRKLTGEECQAIYDRKKAALMQPKPLEKE
ncbi:MAG: MFS transporter [Thermoplasmata archaeon]|nr:MFS transporter [Thermoplasmata archaeon]